MKANFLREIGKGVVTAKQCENKVMRIERERDKDSF